MVLLPPGPRFTFPFGALTKMRRDPLAFLQELSNYGEISRFSAGPRRIYFLNDPELVQQLLVTKERSFSKGYALQQARELLGDGLLTSEGERHLRQRRMMQPAFHRQRIAEYGRVMTTHAERLSASWTSGGTLDVSSEMMRLTLAIVGETLFGSSVESDAAEVDDALTLLLQMFDRLMSPLAPLFKIFPSRARREMLEARGRLFAIVDRMIASRRAAPEEHSDLLSLLLASQDDDGSRMSDEQLRDEVVTLFLAGHETTANALTWSLYLLSQHREIAERVREEARSVSTIDAASYSVLPFTQRVVRETLRLYPPAWVVGRRAIEEVQLGDWTIPKNSIVIASQWVMHHSERFYSEPLTFQPDRWLSLQGLPRFAFFPFGAGGRMCIGDQFALMESTLILATLLRDWHFELDPAQIVEPLPLITLRTKYGMKMKLTRSDSIPLAQPVSEMTAAVG